MEALQVNELPREIERRYLLEQHLGQLLIEQSDGRLIEQYYIGYANESAEFRVRNYSGEYSATLKFGDQIERAELTADIDESVFEQYKQRANGSVTKTRHELSEDQALDQFVRPDVGFILEQEFRSLTEAYAFQMDTHEHIDISTSSELRNRALARLPEAPTTHTSLSGLFDRISHELGQSNELFVIAISGQTASGKSTLAAELAAKYTSPVISLDNYNRGKTDLQHDKEFQETENWDLLQVYNHDQARRHLYALRSGHSVRVPKFNFQTAEPIQKASLINPNHSPVLIVEGIYALDPTVAALADLKVDVRASLPTRLHRRVLRDLERTPWSAQEIFDYCVKKAEPTYSRYQASFAPPDITIDTTLS